MNNYSTQENIYTYFVEATNDKIKKIIEQPFEIVNQRCWELLVQESVWKWPVPKCYGGAGLAWQECIMGIEGLLSVYANPTIFSLITLQLSGVYILCLYGTEKQKKLYLSALMQGKNVNFIISQLCRPLDIQLTKELACFHIARDHLICADYLHFKKLLYGLLATGVALPLIKQYQLFNQSSLKKNDSIQHCIQETRQLYYSALELVDAKFSTLQAPAFPR